MATDDERPAAGDCGPLGCGYADILCRKHTRNHKEEQLERLKRLRKLRVKLDDYRAGGCVGTPPQPSAFGLRLGALSSSEIWWGGS